MTLTRAFTPILRAVVIASMTMVGSIHARAETVMFEDSFDSGVWSDEWEVKVCCQWVQDGWLHSKGADAGGRNSQAMVHDHDKSWRDYEVSFMAQVVPDASWSHIGAVVRSDGYVNFGGVSSVGNAYTIWFNGDNLSNATNTVEVHRVQNGKGVMIAKTLWPLPSDPFSVRVRLAGARISVFMNDDQVINLIDPHPWTFGGAGIWGLWETHGRYDNFRVTAVPAIPEPTTVGLMMLGLGAIGWARRRSRLEASRRSSTH